MRIRGSWISLVSWRNLSTAYNQLGRSESHLSSGLRINSAADDASGLSISQRLRGQYIGLGRASRNALDGMSMLNTADSALSEVHGLLQKGYTLALQAKNGTLTDTNRQYVQDELNQLMSEIDRISDMAEFNRRPLLSQVANAGATAATITGMRKAWLEQAEQVIQQQYGITGDGTTITLVLESSGDQASYITGTAGLAGRLDNIQLHVNLQDFGALLGADGGSYPLYNDRKVARALTQATLARNSNYVALDSWFKSGAADFIAGRDEQLMADVATYGLNAVVSTLTGPWVEDSIHQSAAYFAVKYLSSMLPPFTMQDVMTELSSNDLSSALMNTVGSASVTDFLLDVQANAGAFYSTLNLTDSDVGAIQTGDASTVIPNGDNYTETPLQNFGVEWPDLNTDPQEVLLQVGANQEDIVSVLLPSMSTYTLNLLGLDLVQRPDEAITSLLAASEKVSDYRTVLGTATNRLEHVIQVNEAAAEYQLTGYSRIVDLDFAQELSGLAKSRVLLLSSSAMMVHANAVRQNVMWLLKDLRPNNRPSINQARGGGTQRQERGANRPVSHGVQPNLALG